MCKIIQKSTIYSTEQAFDKNINFKISLGGGDAFFKCTNI